MKAFLQFGGAFCNAPNGPMMTLETQVKETAMPVNRNVTGYGRRIPTDKMVKHNEKWFRVYACCFGNWPTLYIGPSANPIATVDFVTEG